MSKRRQRKIRQWTFEPQRPPKAGRLTKEERIRQARIQSAMVLVAEKMFVLKEITRLLSLASSDTIPCDWFDAAIEKTEAERADAYLQLPLADLRAILCGHSHAGDRGE